MMKHAHQLFFGLAFLILIYLFPTVCPASSPPSLTPAQQYSGELLAYLLKVVLGREGQPESRKNWRERGLNEALDFDHIVKVMTDTGQNQLDFMVLDPNILDLSQVLYYYDEKLSLYKGDYGITSLFPAPEIPAIRLFLLKKIHTKEKIDLDAFIRREKELLDGNYQVSPDDLAATRLSSREMKFLRDIFQNEPGFYRYLNYPFLLKGIAETGILAPGSLVKEIIERADYTPYRIDFKENIKNEKAVKIAVLPAMTQEFHYGWPNGSLSEYGFKPTDFLKDIFNQLKTEILSQTQKRIREIIAKSPYPKLTESAWRKLWEYILEKDIAFEMEDKRPLVIYPKNASQVIREICPKADFTVILLGKNIYRAIYFAAEDICPSVNRLYIDIFDIQYHQAEEEIDQISQFICSRLRRRLTALMDRLNP